MRGGEANGGLVVRVPTPVTSPAAGATVSRVLASTFDVDLRAHEPRRILPATLARWSRAPGQSPPDAKPVDERDRRWLWGAALALLGVEQLLRRSRTRERDERPSLIARLTGRPGRRTFVSPDMQRFITALRPFRARYRALSLIDALLVSTAACGVATTVATVTGQPRSITMAIAGVVLALVFVVLTWLFWRRCSLARTARLVELSDADAANVIVTAEEIASGRGRLPHRRHSARAVRLRHHTTRAGATARAWTSRAQSGARRCRAAGRGGLRRHHTRATGRGFSSAQRGDATEQRAESGRSAVCGDAARLFKAAGERRPQSHGSCRVGR